jgi:hypothetical protein
MKRRRKPHRGAEGDVVAYAVDFVQKRLAGFAKDMQICLTGIPKAESSGTKTYAYFPALMNCCGTLEYLAGLSQGRAHRPLCSEHIAQFAAEFMDVAVYSEDNVRVLWEYFRNKVAHHGIASGVWNDRRAGRRVTWQIEVGYARPALQLVAEAGELRFDPPWPTPYTHRMKIRLGSFSRDITESAQNYVSELKKTPALQGHFASCMRHLYPK